MTPEQKIQKEILTRYFDDNPDDNRGIELNEAGIDSEWERLDENDDLQDYISDFREGEVETKLKCDWSRHYESKAVATKMSDGSWVGWTYWYGGGKHGEPSAIDWMNQAYELDCKEEEKLVIVRTFSLKESQ